MDHGRKVRLALNKRIWDLIRRELPLLQKRIATKAATRLPQPPADLGLPDHTQAIKRHLRALRTLLQRRPALNEEEQAEFWQTIESLDRFQRALGLGDSTFVFLFPYLGSVPTWVTMVRRSPKLDVRRWLPMVRVLCKELDKERPGWRKELPLYERTPPKPRPVVQLPAIFTEGIPTIRAFQEAQRLPDRQLAEIIGLSAKTWRQRLLARNFGELNIERTAIKLEAAVKKIKSLTQSVQ